jgi:hypothetical protein
MIRTQDTAPKAPDHEQIRRDAQEHPERTPSEHEAAARTIAAVSYREEVRRLMAAGTLDPEEEEM